MKEKQSRRIVPVSAVAIALFAMLVAFEAMVIGGILEIKSSTVARIAPWAYEPFLRLVGEHPESHPRKPSSRGGDGIESGVSGLADFNPDDLSIDLEVAGPAVETPVPEAPPTNAPPPDEPKKVVPVG